LYKILLCWRYLLTRYLALACIVSVMLGVATLIVVNSVMSGFSTKLKDRLHGLLSDILIEATTYDGFADPDGKMKRIMQSPIGEHIAAMTPTVEIFAMIQFRYGRETVTRPIRLIGVDPEGRARIGGFAEFLLNPANQVHPSFRLDEAGTLRYLQNHPPVQSIRPVVFSFDPNEPPPPTPPEAREKIPVCAIVGHALASYRKPNHKPGEKPEDVYILAPGDDIIITTVSGQKLAPVYDRFVVCDYFKSEMSEYDSNYVFVPIDYLQHLRTMEGRATSIEIKLKDYRHAKEVVDELQKMFPLPNFMVQTWEAKQGPLLAAILIERGLLNVLLFMIIGVAGFGILAIFSMIVVEKTRDIGILKALGASNRGVMSIFLGYGLLLGVVGAGLGSALGLTITIYINEIENFLTKITGQELFDRSVYYFDKIPTDIQPSSVLLINAGALAIAVLASVLPALRAALLHPVRALRYE
jgi:lipoprotein-releasing system permease protein